MLRLHCGRNCWEIMAKIKKNGRFDGLSEDEVKKKDSLPDYLKHDLDIVFVGINPSLMSAHKGRYYAGPGNHFYKLLHASELVPRFVSFEEDANLLQYKIGLTNIVERATRSSADLTKIEIKQGSRVVAEKLKTFKPKIAVFNGKCIYEVFAEALFGVKKFDFGIQSRKIGDTAIWVVPSSSARCSNFPRMNDKLHFYQAIKRHSQFLNGEIVDADIKEYYFGGKFTQSSLVPKGVKKQEISSNSSVKNSNPQFVVMEIHGESKRNPVQESLNLSESSDEDKEATNGEESSPVLGKGTTIAAPHDIDNLHSKVIETNGSPKGGESEEEDTEYLVELLKRKYENEAKIDAKRKSMKKSDTTNIQKNLGKFTHTKKL